MVGQYSNAKYEPRAPPPYALIGPPETVRGGPIRSPCSDLRDTHPRLEPRPAKTNASIGPPETVCCVSMPFRAFCVKYSHAGCKYAAVANKKRNERLWLPVAPGRHRAIKGGAVAHSHFCARAAGPDPPPCPHPALCPRRPYRTRTALVLGFCYLAAGSASNCRKQFSTILA